MDEPYRVIFYFQNKITSRVFANLNQANEFAKTVDRPIVQKATDPPINRNGNKRVMCNANKTYNRCACGKNKSVSVSRCSTCQQIINLG